MITVKVLSKNQIEEASALLYEVYIEQMNWKFAEDNPSKLRIVFKNNQNFLIDRFTNLATWFGAFDGDLMVGCVRICGVDEYGKFEIEGYQSSQVVHTYLANKNFRYVIELTKAAVKDDYKEKKVIHRLFLAAFKYCEKHHFSIIGCTHNGYLKSLFKRIGYPLIIEHAFKYEPHDPLPVNFYFADYGKQEVKQMITSLEEFGGALRLRSADIFKALEIVAPILPAPVYWHDVSGVVLGLNEHCLKAMGANRDVIGRVPYEFYPREIAEHILTHNEKVIRSGEIMSQEEHVKDIKTGEIRYYSSIKAPLYDDDGSIIGIIGTSIEITSEKEAARLQLENDAYQREMDSQKGFKELAESIMHLLNSYRINTLKEKIGSSKLVNNSVESTSLSKREGEVLYYLSLNKSRKTIANILSAMDEKSIEPTTVQSIIDKQLYPKFGVANIEDLLEKATILNLIPFWL